VIFLPCYSLIKNDCHGECQGQGSCPWCHNFYSDKESRIKKITRRRVVWFVVSKNIPAEIACKWKFFIHRKEIKKLVKDCCDVIEQKRRKHDTGS
jgi:hypothetical protein